MWLFDGSLFCFSILHCCVSGMFIPDPRSWFLSIPDPEYRILDPGSNNSNKIGRRKNLLSYLVLWPQVLQKWKIFHFLTGTKNILAIDKDLQSFLPKYCHWLVDGLLVPLDKPKDCLCVFGFIDGLLCCFVLVNWWIVYGYCWKSTELR